MKRSAFYRMTVLFLVCVISLGFFTHAPRASALMEVYFLETLEEYEAELAKYEIPANYVTYDMVKMVGNFDFLYLGTSRKLSNDGIYMNLVDDAGFYFTLHMQFDVPELRKLYDKWPVEDSVSNPHDLRNTQTTREESWIYQLGDISYGYSGSQLVLIKWKHNDRVYRIWADRSSEGEFCCYPKDTANTFLDRMLDADTAPEAHRELCESIDSAQAVLKRAEFLRDLPGYITAAAAVLLFAAGWIFIWKYTEKRRLLREIEEEEIMAAQKDV